MTRLSVVCSCGWVPPEDRPKVDIPWNETAERAFNEGVESGLAVAHAREFDWQRHVVTMELVEVPS